MRVNQSSARSGIGTGVPTWAGDGAPGVAARGKKSLGSWVCGPPPPYDSGRPQAGEPSGCGATTERSVGVPAGTASTRASSTGLPFHTLPDGSGAQPCGSAEVSRMAASPVDASWLA